MTTTDVFGRIKTNGRAGQSLHFLYGNGFTDGTETELKCQDIAGNLISVGEHLAGHTLQEIGIMCSDGSICTTLKLYGIDGGVVAFWRGNERTTHQFYNCTAKGLSIPLAKGMVLKINTAD